MQFETMTSICVLVLVHLLIFFPSLYGKSIMMMVKEQAQSKNGKATGYSTGQMQRKWIPVTLVRISLTDV